VFIIILSILLTTDIISPMLSYKIVL